MRRAGASPHLQLVIGRPWTTEEERGETNGALAWVEKREGPRAHNDRTHEVQRARVSCKCSEQRKRRFCIWKRLAVVPHSHSVHVVSANGIPFLRIGDFCVRLPPSYALAPKTTYLRLRH